MNDTSITIRIEKDIKTQAERIYSDLGIDLSTAVNVFLRQSIRCNGFPFEVTLNVPYATTGKAAKRAIKVEQLLDHIEEERLFPIASERTKNADNAIGFDNMCHELGFDPDEIEADCESVEIE